MTSGWRMPTTWTPCEKFMMPNLPARPFRSRDGLDLSYRELGAGRPLVLIHGYFSTATVNWIRYGHAAKIAACGYRVIMPDLHAHGDSAKPHEAANNPPDNQTDDNNTQNEELELIDYDLGGYSLGARTTVRMLARGATPGRALLAGMGLEGFTNTGGRGSYFRNILTNLGTFKPGSAQWMAVLFLFSVGGVLLALLLFFVSFV